MNRALLFATLAALGCQPEMSDMMGGDPMDASEWDMPGDMPDGGMPDFGPLRINHLQLRGTVNSYHTVDHNVDPDLLGYIHLPIAEQAEEQGIRFFDFDLNPDRRAGLVLEPEVTTAGSMGRMVITILGMVADMELKFIKDRQRAGIEAARTEGVYKGRKKNVDDEEIRRRVAAGASKASVAREMKVSRMTVYRALDVIPEKTALPDKPPSAAIALHLIIENFNKHGRGRKPARERIEAMLERDYQMQKTGNCDYTLTVAYDQDPDGVSLDDEIENLQSELFNIAENYRCSIETDIHEIGGEGRSW